MRHVLYMKNSTFILLVFLLFTSSCSNYAKVLKSSDYDLKWATAKQYYEENKFVRCTELLDIVMPRYRFTDEAEEMSWIYANCFYKMKDYYSAVVAFQNYYDTYMYGKYAEDAYFYIGMCDYLVSPRAELDQEYTTKAIDDFSYFMTKYPNSEHVADCKKYQNELQERLVEKSYLSARLYYDMSEYKSAIVALTNSLNLYNESSYKEEMMYLKLSALFIYAEKSIASKQRERYQDTLDEYYAFIEAYPESTYARDVKRIYQTTAKFLNIDVDNTENISVENQ